MRGGLKLTGNCYLLVVINFEIGKLGNLFQTVNLLYPLNAKTFQILNGFQL